MRIECPLNENINVDLHIHSAASKYKEADGVVDDSIFENITVLLDKLIENGINLFAFSDHNRFDSDLFWKTKSLLENDEKYKGLSIVASAEVDFFDEEQGSASETGDGNSEQRKKKLRKCHVLTVFDVKNELEAKRLQKAFEECGIVSEDDYLNSSALSELLRKANLNVILIGEQRASLDTEKESSGSFSDAFRDPIKILELGFFSAIECQKPKVQGMLLSQLREINLPVPIMIGSDCHQWCAYPDHDMEVKPKKKAGDPYYFTIKAKPTFKGLLLALTSHETRFNRRSSVGHGYIECLSFGNKNIPLSPGFNAIIGENGSGKSSFLGAISFELGNSKIRSYQKKLMDNYSFRVTQNGLVPQNIKYVEQGELVRNKYEQKKGELNLFSDETGVFKELDTSIFQSSVNTYKDTLIEGIKALLESSSKRDSLKNKTLICDYTKAKDAPHYIPVNASDLEKNPLNSEARVKAVYNILKGIKNEVSDGWYKNRPGIAALLKEAFELTSKARNLLSEEYKIEKADQELQSLITSAFSDYERRIDTISSTKDKASNDYRKERQEFKNAITGALKAEAKVARQKQPGKIDVSTGHVENVGGGYIFRTTANFEEIDCIEDRFSDQIFNAKVNVDSIKTLDQFRSAVRGCGPTGDPYAAYERNVKSFIDKMAATTKTIMIQGNRQKIGQTLGEESLAYYKYITRDDSPYQVLLIDQPEDNISNRRVLNDLKRYFNDQREKRQIILVTHNPLLVVNLDVDNVIRLENKDGAINAVSGCLEYGDILADVADIMDGGKKAIERRIKVYGEED